MKDKPDPKTYREMSIPHPNQDAMTQAMDAFAAEVEAARLKHRMADVSIVIGALCLNENGEDCQSVISWHMGLAMNQPTLLAFALGKSRSELNARLDKLILGKNP